MVRHPMRSTPGRLMIINALVVATCDDHRTCFADGCILVEGPSIAYAGPMKGAPRPDGACRVIDAAGCVAVPGLVNTHHHLFQTLTRALPQVQSAPLFEWLTTLYGIWKRIDEEAVYASALAGIGELLLTGCTTSADHLYLFPSGTSPRLTDQTVRAARELGIRFHPCHGSMTLGRSKGGLPPDDLVQSEEAVLAESERLINAWHDAGPFSMCRLSLAPCAPFNTTPELMRDTAALARRHGVRMHTHLAETADEERYCRDTFGKRPLDVMEDLGWLGPDVWFAHGVHFNEDEIARLARARTGVAHCPTSNMRLGSGIAPAKRMLDCGVPLSLAVDGSASNDSSDMLGELRQCFLAQRVLCGAAALTPDDVLWMATRGGAHVLGRNDIGTLEPGKAADIALFDVSSIGFAGALADPVAALILCGDSHVARTVIVNGEIVVEKGHLVRMGEDTIFELAGRASARLLRRNEV